MTHELESIWKRSAAATSNTSDDVGHLNEYALFRYVGTREGVYRIYPAIGVATKFDPTKQPWSVTAIHCYHKSRNKTV